MPLSREQQIQQWAESGFLHIRTHTGAVKRITFEAIDHSRHLQRQTGLDVFLHRKDGKHFGVWFTNQTKIDCRFKCPVALVPNGDPEQAWWVFPPSDIDGLDGGGKVVAFG
jgi:hypothetical protein